MARLIPTRKTERIEVIDARSKTGFERCKFCGHHKFFQKLTSLECCRCKRIKE